MKKFISMLLVAIAFVGCFSFFGCENNNTPEPEAEPQKETTVINLYVNPYIQFVLDQNNIIMSVKAESDGDLIMSKVNFVGMDATTAAETFAEYCTKLEKIPFETGKKFIKMEIASILDDVKYDKLKNSISTAINTYFQNNYIKSGLKINDKNLLKFAKEYSQFYHTNSFIGTTNEEALELFSKMNKDFEGMTSDTYSDFILKCSDIRIPYQDTLDECEATIDECREQIKTCESQIESATGDEAKRLEIQLSGARTNLKQSIEQIENILNQLEPEFEEAKNKYKKEAESKLVEVKDQAEELLATGIQNLNDYKAQVEQMTNEEKQTLLNEIITYQNSLN